MTLLATGANLAWAVSNAPAYFAFTRALENPRRSQEEILRRYITENADTLFGREHRFSSIDSIETFRARVPLRSYDDFSPWIDRIVQGESCVLTRSPANRLMTSSGSTRAAKLIPYTGELQNDFNRAIGPWIIDLFRTDPSLMRGCAYWSISPVAKIEVENRASAVPIGFEEDSAYLGGVRRKLVDAAMAVPGAVRHCAQIATFRYVTLRFVLARRDLRIISVWHPSFLELLLDSAKAYWDQLLTDIERGSMNPPGELEPAKCRDLERHLRADSQRAAELRAIGPSNVSSFWPNLRLISAWGSLNAHSASKSLAQRFPTVRFQAKGLLATEAFVTIPFAGHWPIAVRSHIFEFLDDEQCAYCVDELRDGGEYEVVVTTGGGLWRYRLGDRVRVVGHVGKTPSLEFLGRADQVSDRFGEKLSEGFVAESLRKVLADLSPAFAMLAPDGTEKRYALLIDSAVPAPMDLAARLDTALCENPHYAYCRAIGQLDVAKVLHVKNAYERYVHALAAEGQRIGDIKPAALSLDARWPRVLSAST